VLDINIDVFLVVWIAFFFSKMSYIAVVFNLQIPS